MSGHVERDRRHVPVQDILLRALAVLRAIVLVNAVVLYAMRVDDYARPVLGWVVVVGLAAWSALVVWAYGAAARRTAAWLVPDLAVAVAAILLTPVVKGASPAATLPGFYVMVAVLTWAVVWHWQGGLLAAVLVTVADVSIRDEFTQQNYGNIFLLLVGGAIIGFLSALLQQTAAQRDAAERAAAAAEERQRLSRVVHDGVLQVLALVQRRGPELGPDGRELGRLAGEQEGRLRALVQQGSRELVAPLGERDLAELLGELDGPRVHVALPAEPVVLPAEQASELLAAVEACLSNVRHHVGRDAEAWVLLEVLPDRWVVSVRDDGPGIAPGRLEASAAEGRLGVQQSIVGRLEDLGGSAEVSSAPGQGAEWELVLPRQTASR
ncbi:MacS family sensor histidine kinase [Nocardioides marmoraquaticus]